MHLLINTLTVTLFINLVPIEVQGKAQLFQLASVESNLRMFTDSARQRSTCSLQDKAWLPRRKYNILGEYRFVREQQSSYL